MYIIIKTTTNSKEIADKISNQILSKKLSPCINIYRNICSKYVWGNNVKRVREYIIEIKTKRIFKNHIVEIIKTTHNYSTPEIISTNFNILSNKYKKWFDKSL